jgi:Asp-tRNA(Asn)/Glu-tRNA(Gln) amidotransferase A subunit family amidase
MPSLGVMLAVAMAVAAAQPARAPFRLQEATIAGVHEALAAGRLTCVALTKAYLDRIEAYNLRGPALRAVIAVNPKAMDTASELDRQYKANRAGVGPLHCIPIVLKDNFDTVDMPTTGGYVGMKRSQPKADAFTVRRER